MQRKRGDSEFRKLQLQSAFCERCHEDLLTGIPNATMDARAGRMCMRLMCLLHRIDAGFQTSPYIDERAACSTLQSLRTTLVYAKSLVYQN
jgi:hypothetical protein